VDGWDQRFGRPESFRISNASTVNEWINKYLPIGSPFTNTCEPENTPNIIFLFWLYRIYFLKARISFERVQNFLRAEDDIVPISETKQKVNSEGIKTEALKLERIKSLNSLIFYKKLTNFQLDFYGTFSCGPDQERKLQFGYF